MSKNVIFLFFAICCCSGNEVKPSVPEQTWTITRAGQTVQPCLFSIQVERGNMSFNLSVAETDRADLTRYILLVDKASQWWSLLFLNASGLQNATTQSSQLSNFNSVLPEPMGVLTNISRKVELCVTNKFDNGTLYAGAYYNGICLFRVGETILDYSTTNNRRNRHLPIRAFMVDGNNTFATLGNGYGRGIVYDDASCSIVDSDVYVGWTISPAGIWEHYETVIRNDEIITRIGNKIESLKLNDDETNNLGER